jgi:nitrogen fixation-related uncharacterized protein
MNDLISDNQLGVNMGFKLKLGASLVTVVVLILTTISLTFLWLSAKEFQICYRTFEEATEGCGQTPRFQSSKKFNPQLGNAQDVLVLLICITILIVYAILAYRWWSKKDSEDKVRRQSMSIPAANI